AAPWASPYEERAASRPRIAPGPDLKSFTLRLTVKARADSDCLCERHPRRKKKIFSTVSRPSRQLPTRGLEAAPACLTKTRLQKGSAYKWRRAQLLRRRPS